MLSVVNERTGIINDDNLRQFEYLTMFDHRFSFSLNRRNEPPF